VFDPPPQHVPDAIANALTPAVPTFTRAITVDIAPADFPLASAGTDSVPRVNKAVLHDSFLPGEQFNLKGEDLIAAGKPVLPLLTYDLTLQNTGNDGRFTGTGDGIPQPRGVRLVKATALPEVISFNPHITTITTDTTAIQQLDDPDLTVQGQWLPAEPYTYQRTSSDNVYTDKLLVSPAQFWGGSARDGRLRRYTQMVFEVSYIDPESAPLSLLTDNASPRISNVAIAPATAPRMAAATAAALKVTAKVADAGATGGLDVRVTYSGDGKSWSFKPLTYNPATGLFEALINAPTGGNNIFVIVEARDKAGNVSTYTAKGSLLSYTFIRLPLVLR
jgi:hypothetical protein